LIGRNKWNCSSITTVWGKKGKGGEGRGRDYYLPSWPDKQEKRNEREGKKNEMPIPVRFSGEKKKRKNSGSEILTCSSYNGVISRMACRG